jgi:hypothetical protein
VSGLSLSLSSPNSTRIFQPLLTFIVFLVALSQLLKLCQIPQDNCRIISANFSQDYLDFPRTFLLFPTRINFYLATFPKDHISFSVCPGIEKTYLFSRDHWLRPIDSVHPTIKRTHHHPSTSQDFQIIYHPRTFPLFWPRGSKDYKIFNRTFSSGRHYDRPL